jgi:cysteine desulfurase family protein (TIGR01976 family)
VTALASVESIRAAFPALRRTVGAHPVAYFDGPGGTQVPGVVTDAVTDYLLHHNANTHWAYPTSAETDAALLDARDVFAAFMGGTADEISFGNNMTTITFHVARALARDWKPGDEVIVTEIDHHGNIAPWQAIARDHGIVLKWLALDTATGLLRLDQLPQLLGPKTRLLAINAASNILGTISDVASAAELAHAAGALVFVDGVHYAPHQLPDAHQLGADFLAVSAYKFHGPHIGVLWARRDLTERLDVPRLEPAPDTSPERWETGTQNHEGVVGAAAAVRWLAGLAGQGALRPQLAATYGEIHRREMVLFTRLWDGLGAIPGVTRYGLPPGGNRTATISFVLDGAPSEQVARRLAHSGCFVSHGDFYATTVARLLGCERDGLVRIGAACYTTADEIERVLQGIEDVAAQRDDRGR